MAEETNVVKVVQPEPEILACEACEGVSFHIYSDGVMVCINKKCGERARFDLFEVDE